MHRWTFWIFLLLVPQLAQAEGPERAPSPAEPGQARFEKALEERVGDVLDRSVDLAADRAVALLEERAAEGAEAVAARRAPRVWTVTRWRGSAGARWVPVRWEVGAPRR